MPEHDHGGYRGGGRFGLGSAVWTAGWLFSIGYLHLPIWRGVLALFIWPYFLGAAVAPK